jgi:4-amino-4-deoxy-L-arabinose transferase-like glycosyltransferase
MARWSAAVSAGVLVASAVLMRLWFSAGPHTGLDSDEAIVGLMAVRFLRHGEVPPAFYWGQSYGGSLEAIFVLPFVWLFGTTTLGLRSASMLFELLAGWLTWRVARRLFEPRIANFVGALSLFWPLAAVWFGTRERGFYPSTAVLGLTCVLLALQIDEQPGRRWRWVGFGLVAGVGWWMSPNIVYYVAPIALWLAIRGHWRNARSIAVAAVAAILGAVVWITASFNNHFASLKGPNVARSSTFFERFRFFWTHGLPFSLGLRRPWNGNWYVNRSLDTVLYIGFLALAVFVLRKRKLRDSPEVFLFATAPLVYALYRGNYLLVDGRYTFFVASLLPLLVGRIVAIKIGRTLIAALLVTATFGFIGGYESLVRPTPGSSKPLADRIRAAGFHTAVGNYWDTFKMTFESNEGVIASPMPGQPGSRYPPYAETVLASSPAYVFKVSGSKPNVRALEQTLDQRHIRYQVIRSGWYEAVLPETHSDSPNAFSPVPSSR